MARLLDISEAAYQKYETRSLLPHHLIERFAVTAGAEIGELLSFPRPPSVLPLATNTAAAPRRRGRPPGTGQRRGDNRLAVVTTVSTAIDALGGTGATARLFEVLPSTVSNWKKTGYFPPRLAIPLGRVASARGLTIPDALFREVPAPRRLHLAGDEDAS